MVATSGSFFTLGHLLLGMCHSSLHKGLPSFHIMGMVPGLNNSIRALTIDSLVSAVCVWLLKTCWLESFKKREREVNAYLGSCLLNCWNSAGRGKHVPEASEYLGLKPLVDFPPNSLDLSSTRCFTGDRTLLILFLRCSQEKGSLFQAHGRLQLWGSR